MKHGEVAKRLSRAIHCLKEASTIFLDEIFNAVDQLPYCLLYSAKVLKQALHDKFPNAPEKDVLKVRRWFSRRSSIFNAVCLDVS